MRWPLALLLWAGLARAACAQADIRVGDHGSFGRLVLSLAPGVAMPAPGPRARQGDRLVLDLPGAGAVLPPAGLTMRHVLGVQGGQDKLVLALAPGSTTRIWRMGRRLVVDVFGGDAKPGLMPPVATSARPPPVQPPVSPLPAPVRQATLPPPPPEPAPAFDPAPPIEEASPPPPSLAGAEALRATRLPGPGDAILLPFDAKVGAAAFAANGMAHAVFDDSKAIDMAALKDDPVFAGARITVSPGSTHFTMALPPAARLALARQPEGWAVSVETTRAGWHAAPVRLRGETLTIGMARAADVVVLIDPVTGARRLVGTVHGTGRVGGGQQGAQGDGPRDGPGGEGLSAGGGVEVGHVSPEFRLLPSWAGVVLDVVSDRLALTATREGFALDAESGPKLSTILPEPTQAALEGAGGLTRRFAMAPLSVAALRARLAADLATAAHAPRQARFRPRLAAAQDMLGLGMDREAAALLAVARDDDPAQEARPDGAALLAMARWLAGGQAGRVAGDESIDAPRLGGADEVALWRALMPPRGAAATPAARAAVVAADWRLLIAYPALLRRRLMPAAASILIDGHATVEAAALLATCADLALEGERARLLAAAGRQREALAILDRLASGRDRRQAALALRESTEMRLAAHAITPQAAARALDRQLYTWRDPDFELERRLRIAALQTQAGQFRDALAGLREADQVFAQAHDRVHDSAAQTVRALLRPGGADALAPMDLLALVGENADLLGQGEVAVSLTPVLVDKLAALDLPERADRLVAKLIDSTQDEVPKAALGARLAGLRLDQNDPAGALAALDQTMGGALPPEVESRRAVSRARALAQLGEDGPALSLLATQEGVESWEMQAKLREKSHDWHGADIALQKLAQARVPASGVLNDSQQDLVLRLASAASQAGDSATLRALATGAGQRLGPGPRAALFTALIVQPVREVADLPRAQREAEAAAALPAAWAGYAAR